MSLRRVRGRTLAPGSARGVALVLGEPLSFWGGVDPETGTIIDARHPQAGESVSGRVLVMLSGRGSSSSSSVLAEALRAGTGPAAILLGEPDPILVLGTVVAQELYGAAIPVVVLDAEAYAEIGRDDQCELEVSAGESGALISRRSGPPGGGSGRTRSRSDP